jgi:hypothetical protein
VHYYWYSKSNIGLKFRALCVRLEPLFVIWMVEKAPPYSVSASFDPPLSLLQANTTQATPPRRIVPIPQPTPLRHLLHPLHHLHERQLALLRLRRLTTFDFSTLGIKPGVYVERPG